MSGNNYLLEKILPDGRITGIAFLTFGRARIVIGPSPFVDNGW